MSDPTYTKISGAVALRERKVLQQLTAKTRASVEHSSIVLVPDEGFRDHEGPVFPQSTVDFLQFLREHAPLGTEVAIAADDTGYAEVVLHSDIVRLATVFVEYVAAPIAMSLIAAYLKDFLGSRLGRAEARASIVVHRKDGAVEQTVRIAYEGPAQNVEQAMSDALATLPAKMDTAITGAVTDRAPQRKPPKQSAKKKRTKRRK